MAGGAPGHGEAAPGDHLQTLYHLWLPGHQVEHGRAPWRDPYTFQPESSPRVNFGGWPFGLPYWPLFAAFGVVLAWNLFVLLTYLIAGGFTCLWLRELGLPLGAALVGGLAFAIAPYRVAQSTGHLLGPISILLPLTLWAIERRRFWLAAPVRAAREEVRPGVLDRGPRRHERAGEVGDAGERYKARAAESSSSKSGTSAVS